MREVADKFVLVRLVRISGADLSLFDFDYDLTWAGIFLSADEIVYGRFGGRDDKSDDGRLSIAGLAYAMQRALTRHTAGDEKPARRGKPVKAEEFAAAKARKGNSCIHCHQVNEFQRADAKATGTWIRASLWVYPPPETIGLTLDLARGDLVKSVAPNSAAAKAGLKAGDVLERLNGHRVASFADAQFALHHAPASGSVPVEWTRGDKSLKTGLDVRDGWKKSNITWRASLHDVIPELLISGADLTTAEKTALGLPKKRAAFRQDKFVHSTLRAVGLKTGDVIVGVDGSGVDGTMDDFIAFVRGEHLIGETVVLKVLRDGKAIELKLTLK